jgi:hypothetical protein
MKFLMAYLKAMIEERRLIAEYRRKLKAARRK